MTPDPNGTVVDDLRPESTAWLAKAIVEAHKILRENLDDEGDPITIPPRLRELAMAIAAMETLRRHLPEEAERLASWMTAVLGDDIQTSNLIEVWHGNALFGLPLTLTPDSWEAA